MRIGAYRFRPSLVPSVATLLVLPLLLALGFWQLDRAEQKRQIRADLAAGSEAAVVDLQRTRAPYERLRYHRARAEGRWDARQFLVANQIRDGRPGYLVLTPLRLADGDAVLVDRGWVPAPANFSRLPEVDLVPAPAAVEGIIDQGPSVGLRMGPPSTEDSGWPRRLAYVDYDYMAAQLGYPLRPYLIHLEPDAPAGYRRDWEPAPAMGPEKHLGYAFQWFALATALVVIYLVVNLKREDDTDGRAQ